VLYEYLVHSTMERHDSTYSYDVHVHMYIGLVFVGYEAYKYEVRGTWYYYVHMYYVLCTLLWMNSGIPLTYLVPSTVYYVPRTRYIVPVYIYYVCTCAYTCTMYICTTCTQYICTMYYLLSCRSMVLCTSYYVQQILPSLSMHASAIAARSSY